MTDDSEVNRVGEGEKREEIRGLIKQEEGMGGENALEKGG